MNSFVSVEDEEVCCEGLQNLVLNASNISGSSVDSESGNKKSEACGEEYKTKDNSSVDGLLVSFSESPDHLNDSLNVAVALPAPESGLAVDLQCLPILLGSEAVFSLSGDIDITFEDENLFNSDVESNSSFDGFDGTTEISRSGTFHGFPQKTNETSDSPTNQIKSDKENKLGAVSAKRRGRPRKSISSKDRIETEIETKQDNSKGVTCSVYHSTVAQSKKEDNASREWRREKSEEEAGVGKDLGLPFGCPKIKPDFDTSSISSTSSVQSFEGFSINDLIKPSVDIQVQEEKECEIDKSDGIGCHCSAIGCTVSWLETGNVKELPANITNGVVNELSEFSKKISWEPKYIAQWILRLRGYDEECITEEDMEKIHLVMKRRRAITINFAGSATYKSKLASFDFLPFSLPTAEKYDKIKLFASGNNEELDQTKSDISHTPLLNLNDDNDNIDPVTPSTCTAASSFKKENVINNKNDFPKTTDDFHILGPKSSHPVENGEENVGNRNEDNQIMCKALPSESNEEMLNILDATGSNSAKLDNEKDAEKREIFYSTPKKDFVQQECDGKLGVSKKGRIRKPTSKVQEFYSHKTPSGFSASFSPKTASSEKDNKISPKTTPVKTDKALCNKKGSTSKMYDLKLNNFVDDGRPIGEHCRMAHIDIQLLNSNEKAKEVITNGVVYELYHFFKNQKATLTTLVHTIYRLKDVPIYKSPIIATMAKVHEMVKVMWDEHMKIDPEMSYKEFQLTDTISSKSTNNKINDAKLNDSVKDNSIDLEGQQTSGSISTSYGTVPSNETRNSSSDKKAFNLNVTRGNEGEITRGDIFYLYTRWLKKKMESQSEVFVTDLSKQVENLIMDRKVKTIRIPVGTLMSSSVKIFEDFRRLSKTDIEKAESYLLEDWIQDIKGCMNDTKKSCKVGPKMDVPSSNEPHSKHPSGKSGLRVPKLGGDDSNGLLPLTPELDSSVDPNKSKKKPKVNKSMKNSNQNVLFPTPEEYEVEKIVGYRIVKIGKESITEYRVRWSGFSSMDDSWVNVSDLKCPEILSDFWEALKKQRSLKTVSPLNVIQSGDADVSHNGEGNVIQAGDTNIFKKGDRKIVKVSDRSKVGVKPTDSAIKSPPAGQENVSPFMGHETSISKKFFSLMINSLTPNIIDYQYSEEENFPKRAKVTKGEVLDIYDSWRQGNQEKLLAGASRPVDVNVLISKVKELMDRKKLRNFNPDGLIDACYRMFLMKSKLKDEKKIQEYLNGDFMDLHESSRRHRDSVCLENSEKMKKRKLEKTLEDAESQMEAKITKIDKLQKESLLMANYMRDHAFKPDFAQLLEKDIAAVQKLHSLRNVNQKCKNIEFTKKDCQELKDCGVNDDTIQELIEIALRPS